MLHSSYMRICLTVIWIVSFIAMCIIFQTFIPNKAMIDNLEAVEKNITDKDWTQAGENMNNFIEQWESNKLLIQSNNATEEVLTFQHALVQARTLIEQKEDSAIEYVAGLKQMADSITKVFPAP